MNLQTNNTLRPEQRLECHHELLLRLSREDMEPNKKCIDCTLEKMAKSIIAAFGR